MPWIKQAALATFLAAVSIASCSGRHADHPAASVQAAQATRDRGISDLDHWRSDSDEHWRDELRANGYGPIPDACGEIKPPIVSADQAVCIALAYVGDELDRGQMPYFYRPVRDEGTWSVRIVPARAFVAGGAFTVELSAKSAAVLSARGEK